MGVIKFLRTRRDSTIIVDDAIFQRLTGLDIDVAACLNDGMEDLATTFDNFNITDFVQRVESGRQLDEIVCIVVGSGQAFVP
ncbi:hypothetical protein D9M68_916430 [compost metagenome]